MATSATPGDVDYAVGQSMIFLPDIIAIAVLCGIGLLSLVPYCDRWERRLAKLSGKSAWLLLCGGLAPWLVFFGLFLYFTCHGLLVVLAFIPTWWAEAKRIESGGPLFPVQSYSQYTLYFLEAKSQITFGSAWDTVVKGFTPSGVSLLFGNDEMKFSSAQLRAEGFWHLLSRDRFAGAVIKAVFALVNFTATIGSSWGFFILLGKAKRRWANSIR